MLGKLLRINAEPWVLLIFLVIALLTSTLACSRQDSAMAPPPGGNRQLSVDNLLVDIELLDTINRLELTTRVKSLLRVRHLKGELERTLEYLSVMETEKEQPPASQ